jgi:serine/threonine-protein kinase
MTPLPVNLNPRISELLRRCLEKDPRRRWHAMADVRVEIEVILADPRGLVTQAPTVAARRSLWRRAIPATAAVLAGTAIAGSAAWVVKTPPIGEVTRFVFSVPGFTFLGRQVVSVSPDGSQFVYVSGSVLQLRAMSELDSFPVQGVPSDTRNPVFSPDGQSIVFWTITDGTLKRISTSGGAPVTLCAADNPFGMSWGEDDQIVFGQGAKGIFRVNPNGGESDVLVSSESGELLQSPQVLPGGSAVLFTSLMEAGGQWDQAKIFVQPLPSGERKLLIDRGADARYLPTGHIVYFLGGDLIAVPFDVQNRQVTGRPAPVIENVRFADSGNAGSAQFSVSRTGTLIYVPSPPSTTTTAVETTLTVVDSDGGGTPLVLPTNPYVSVRASPDGKQLAVGTDNGTNADIWVYDLSGKTALRRLTLSGRNLYPIWSGDSKRVLFQSNRDGDLAVWWQPADGTGTADRLTKPETGDSHVPESWLPNTQTFSYRVSKGGQDVWLYSVDEKKGAPLVAIPSSDQYDSTFSPDGRWVAYRSRGEAGRNGIYVEPYPPTGARYLLGVNENIAWGPTWSPDSKKVFFHRQGGGQLHYFALQTEPAMQHLQTVDIPVTQFRWSSAYRMYDVLPDGKRFVVLRNAQPNTASGAPPTQPEIRVVLNWFEELKKLAPAP